MVKAAKVHQAEEPGSYSPVVPVRAMVHYGRVAMLESGRALVSYGKIQYSIKPGRTMVQDSTVIEYYTLEYHRVWLGVFRHSSTNRLS